MMEIETIDIEVQDYVKKLVNVVTKTIVDSFENLTIEDVNMFKLGYNKAIDDLTANIIERFPEWLCQADYQPRAQLGRMP